MRLHAAMAVGLKCALGHAMRSCLLNEIFAWTASLEYIADAVANPPCMRRAGHARIREACDNTLAMERKSTPNKERKTLLYRPASSVFHQQWCNEELPRERCMNGALQADSNVLPSGPFRKSF
jgi:hypothetical protein